ncbi:MAG: S-methyl-5-thioribose-1-phosphate isomerase [Nitrososphaeria archaeon]|nr:S-methyl-5-thioribose-1-phosphate isomerase [Nitrososphaeria archaeon]
MKHIKWTGECLKIIDQRKLPGKVKYIFLKNLEEFHKAIVEMKVRGAPLIGIVGAFAIAVLAQEIKTDDRKEFLKKIEEGAKYILESRPTAYNLQYCVKFVCEKISECNHIEDMRKVAIETAQELMEREIENSRRIGEYGETLLNDGDTILTHCNAGELATIAYGTALAPIRIAQKKGKCLYVIATETRPAQQGARLTAWELLNEKIPVTVISDTAVGYVMSKGMVDKVIVGADRITKEGYVFNKIGTYQIALLAKEHNLPFYVAAPTSTFDINIEHNRVVIEERDANEIVFVGRKRIVAKGVKVYNPVFDKTPPNLINAIITEKGIIHPPFEKSISKLFS